MAEDVVHNIDINLQVKGAQAATREIERVFAQIAGGAGGSVGIGGVAANLRTSGGFETASQQLAKIGAELQKNLSGTGLQQFTQRLEALQKALISGGSALARHVVNTTSANNKIGVQIDATRAQQIQAEAEAKARATALKAAGLTQAGTRGSGTLVQAARAKQEAEAPTGQRVVSAPGTRQATAAELAAAAANPDENRTRARQILKEAQDKFDKGTLLSREERAAQRREARQASLEERLAAAQSGLDPDVVRKLVPTPAQKALSAEADKERAAKKAEADAAKQRELAESRRTIAEQEATTHQQRFGTGVAFPAHGSGLPANPAADRSVVRDSAADLARQAKEQRAYALSSLLVDFGRGYRTGPAQTLGFDIGPGHPWYGGPAQLAPKPPPPPLPPAPETDEERRARVAADVARQEADRERRDKLRAAGLNPYAPSGPEPRAALGRTAEIDEEVKRLQQQNLAALRAGTYPAAREPHLVNGVPVGGGFGDYRGRGGGPPPPPPAAPPAGPPDEGDEKNAKEERLRAQRSLINAKREEQNAAEVSAAAERAGSLSAAQEQVTKRAKAAALKRQVEEIEVQNALTARGVSLAEGISAAEAKAHLTAIEKAEVLAQQVRVLRVILGEETESVSAEQGVIALGAERKALLKRQNDEIEKGAKALAGQPNYAGQGTLFQRFSAAVRRRTGDPVDPTTLPTLGQQIGQSAIRSASFAVAGGGVYTVVANLRTLVQESERVQVAFGQLQAQMNAVGKGDQFGGVRDRLLGMARDSGVAADEVAKLGSIMLGAFGDSTKEALGATNAGLALVQVGGLSIEDVLNNLVAVTKSFGISGTDAMNKVDDQVIHLKDTFGVSVKEIIDGVGNIAPLANELGLSFKDASTLIAGASAVSGRSATQTANEIGRALTQIQKNAPGILQIFDQPNSQGALKNIQKDLASGNIGQVLIETIRNWKSLSKVQQDTFLTLIGGRREFASLAAALGESDKIIAEIDDKSSHYGRTAQSLAEYHKSLSYQIKVAKEALFQFGNAILQSPIGQGLGIIVHGLADMARWIGTLLHWLSELNGFTHGATGEFLSMAAAIYAVSKVAGPLGGVLRDTGRTVFGKITGRGGGAGSEVAAGGETAGASMRAGIISGSEVGAAEFEKVLSSAGLAQTRAAELQLDAAKLQVDAAAKELEASAVEETAATQQLTAATEQAATGFRGLLGRVGASAGEFGGTVTGALGGGALAQLAGTIAPALVAYTAGRAATAGGGFIAGLTAGRESGVDVHTRTTGGFLGLGGRTEVANQEEIAAASSKQFDKLSLAQVRAIAQQHHAGISLGPLGIGSFSPGHTEARNVRINAARQYLGQSLAEHGNDQYNRDIINALDISQKDKDKLLKGIDDGDYKTYDKVTALYKKQKGNTGFQSRLKSTQAKSHQATVAANAVSGQTLENAQDLQKEYESHRISYEALQSGLARQINELQGVVDQNPNDPAALELQKQLNALKDQFASNQQKQADQLRQVADLRDQDPLKAAQRALDAAQHPAGGPEIHGPLGIHFQLPGFVDPVAVQTAQNQVDQEKQNIKIAGLQQSQAVDAASGNQVKVAQDDVNIAQQQLAFAKGDAAKAQAQANLTQKKRALVEAQLNVSQSRQALQRDLLSAQSGDPLSAAQNDVTSADEQANVANRLGNVYDQLQAQKNRVEQNRKLAEMISQIGQAQIDLAIAYADAAGDVNQVAALQTEKATKALNDYLAAHPGSNEGNDPQVSQLKAAVVTANNNQRVTANNEQIANIDFLQQAGKITTANAIASLTAILNTMKEGTQEYRDLYLKIEGLKKQAAGSTGFNAPSDIKLPTLYESRRLQAAGTGQNYDQRQVTVTMYVNNGMDEQRAGDFLANALGGRRVGTVPRSY